MLLFHHIIMYKQPGPSIPVYPVREKVESNKPLYWCDSYSPDGVSVRACDWHWILVDPP